MWATREKTDFLYSTGRIQRMAGPHLGLTKLFWTEAQGGQMSWSVQVAHPEASRYL